MVSGSVPGTLERKIYFYRADIGTDEGGQPLAFDPSPALDAIDSLPFTNDDHGRYEFDADGNALRVRRHNAVPNVTLQFGRVRRNGLPMLEQAGNISDLVLDVDTGLLEAIHVVFFPDNIVGAEYNHFGPRVSRLGSYLHKKSSEAVARAAFRPILRGDAAKQLDRLSDCGYWNSVSCPRMSMLSGSRMCPCRMHWLQLAASWRILRFFRSFSNPKGKPQPDS